MNNSILVALLGFFGTVIGSLGGVLASNKLTNYRIQKLEEKVDKHNPVIERTYALEGRMREAEHDIKELKNK